MNALSRAARAGRRCGPRRRPIRGATCGRGRVRTPGSSAGEPCQRGERRERPDGRRATLFIRALAAARRPERACSRRRVPRAASRRLSRRYRLVFAGSTWGSIPGSEPPDRSRALRHGTERSLSSSRLAPRTGRSGLLGDGGCQALDHGDVSQQLLRQAVPFLQVRQAVIGDPDPSFAILPDQNLEREIERDAWSG
jgi:hypothetical protein